MVLAEMVVPIVTSFLLNEARTGLSEGMKSFSGEVGKSAWNLVKGLFQTDKQKKIVTEFEKEPNDNRVRLHFMAELDDLLQVHPDVAAQLEKLLLENSNNHNQLIIGNANNSFNNVNKSFNNVDNSHDIS